MTTADDILKSASGRTTTVWVCPDAGLFSRWQQAEQAYDQAKRMRGGTLGDDDDAAALRDDAETLRDQVDAALVELELAEVRPGRLRQLQADHALSKKDAEKRGLRAGALDEDRFWPALAAEAIVAPTFTVEQAAQLLDTSHEVRTPLIAALDQLHGGGRDPKAVLATARRRNSTSS